uniref:Ald_Xan_dh_C2 domain-containing protein n=1 Tax=Macrostomum lignano TaxID=282301 RepID=A0A1I8FGI6_9PLAT
MRIFFCRLSLHFGPTDEALLSIRLPFCGRREFQFGFQAGPSREDDIAIVNAGMLVRFFEWRLRSGRVRYRLFGGVAPVTRVATGAAEADRPALVGGAPLSRGVCRRLDAEFPAQYRKSLCTSFLSAFYIGSVPNLLREGSTRKGRRGRRRFGGGAFAAATRGWARCCSSGQPPGQLREGPGWQAGAARLRDRNDLPPSLGEVFRLPGVQPARRRPPGEHRRHRPPGPGPRSPLASRPARRPPEITMYGIDLSDDRIFATPRFDSTARRRCYREGSYFPEKLCAGGSVGAMWMCSGLRRDGALHCGRGPRPASKFALWPALNAIGGGFGGKEYRSIGTAAVPPWLPYRFWRARALRAGQGGRYDDHRDRHPAMIRLGVNKERPGGGPEGGLLPERWLLRRHLLLRLRVHHPAYGELLQPWRGGHSLPTLPHQHSVEHCLSRLRRPAGDDRHRDDHVAPGVGLRPHRRAIRELNFFRNGDVSIYGHAYEDECLALADYEARKAEVDRFNSSQSYRKRGLHITPLCYGIGFGRSFLQQAGALVNVYLDGSVLITHGGVEMGQGLHTKLLQVAARVLDLPIERLYISETATDKVPNTIRDRLLPYMHSEPKAGWDSWVNAAYMDGGRPYNYYTFGAACSEVEIDLLTGDHVTRRSDIVMDLGASLNPAVDIGQIEGAFRASAAHQGPGAYKIPGFGDIPEEFNVQLLRGSLCKFPRAVYSSKGVGEPPICLAASVFMAIRDAVAAARRQHQGEDSDAGGSGFRFDAPPPASESGWAAQMTLLTPSAPFCRERCAMGAEAIPSDWATTQRRLGCPMRVLRLQGIRKAFI